MKNMPCAYWREGDRCAKSPEPGVDDFCVLGPCTQEVPTNADRIRAMSDEELAKMLTTVAYTSAKKLAEKAELDISKCDFSKIQQTHLDWLQSPAEGDGNDG